MRRILGGSSAEEKEKDPAADPWALSSDTGRLVQCGAVGLALASLTYVAHVAPATETKAGCFLVAVLLLQLSGLVPQYCVGLLTPVFATVLRTMPLAPAFIAHKCFAAMFNPMTAVVLGSFSVNAICVACRLDARLLQACSRFGDSPRRMLLVLMLGSMWCSALVFVTLLLLTTVTPWARKDPRGGGAAVVLGVGVACAFGSVLTPIAGAPALITLSVLSEYGSAVSFANWVLVAVPTMTCVCVAAWAVLLLIFGAPPALDDADRKALCADPPPLTRRQVSFLALAALFFVGCVAQPVLEPVVGDAGNLGLLLTALTFSILLAKDEFLQLPWDIIAMLFGVNIITLVIKESGLGLQLATFVINVQHSSGHLWVEVAKLAGIAAVLASLAPHGVVATIAMPIVVALGLQLYAPALVALLVVMAIACGLGTPHAATDLLLISEEMERAPAQRRILTRADFIRGGAAVTFVAWLVITTVGFGTGLFLVGMPEPKIIRHKPAALQPSSDFLHRLRELEERIDRVDPGAGNELDDLLGQLDQDTRALDQGGTTHEAAAAAPERVSAEESDWGQNATAPTTAKPTAPPWGWGNSYSIGPRALRGPDGELIPLNDPPGAKLSGSSSAPDKFSDEAYVHTEKHSAPAEKEAAPDKFSDEAYVHTKQHSLADANATEVDADDARAARVRARAEAIDQRLRTERRHKLRGDAPPAQHEEAAAPAQHEAAPRRTEVVRPAAAPESAPAPKSRLRGLEDWAQGESEALLRRVENALG